jgi:hypothetical protein
VTTTPTVEECVCFLERNETLRQIIGLLMQLEEEDQDDGKVNSHEDMVKVNGERNHDDNSVAGCETDSYYCNYDASEEFARVHESYYVEFGCKNLMYHGAIWYLMRIACMVTTLLTRPIWLKREALLRQ